ncbi:unnamed protein product, partial [Iphiclides podalirius]
MMLKFRGFKASFNLLSGKKSRKEQYEKPSGTSVLGAYRGYSEEYFVNSYQNKQQTTPSLAKSNTSEPTRGIKPSKSTSDLTRQNDRAKDTRKSTSDLPSSSLELKNGKEIRSSEGGQRKLDKQTSTEQKKKDKLARDSETEQKSRRKENDGITQDRGSKEVQPRREKKKTPAPRPPVSKHYPSDTLEGSISRSSGPPPYSAELVPTPNDGSGNTSFGKQVEAPNSWDLVSQHRQQLRKPQAPVPRTSATVLDLGYHVDTRSTAARGKDDSVV